MKKYTTILFDLDGTLTNSELGISNCFKHALKQLEVSADGLTIKKYIGPPLLASFTEILGDTEKAKKATQYYRERFTTVGLFENEMYEGIPDTLKKLKAAGYILGVATSKPEVFALKIIKHFNLDQYFDFVVGATLDGIRGEKEDVINYILKHYALKKEQVILVGDTQYDLKGAQICGIDAIGVLYGFGEKQMLLQYPHLTLVEQPQHIYTFMMESFEK